MTEKKEKFPSTFTVDNFSSTMKLAPSDTKLPIGSNETLNEKQYRPFEHRQVDHPTSSAGILIHLMKSSLGTGILAMPNAVKNGGLIFGLFGTVLVGIICTHCVYLLVAASHEICRRAKKPMMGFSETAGSVFEHGPVKLRPWSKAAVIFVDAALVITYYMGGAVYIVFISASIKQLVDHFHPELEWGIIPYIFLITVPIIISCQLRELKHLVPFSFLANIFLCVSFGITLYYVFDGFEFEPEKLEMVGTISSIPFFFSTVIFAMEGIGIILPLENSMKKPQHFIGRPGVLYIGMTVVVILYGLIGFCGYMKYGNDILGSVTFNIPSDQPLSQAAKVLIAMAVFFTYSLQFHVPIEITWKKMLRDRIPVRFHNLGQIITRSVIVTITACIAAAVPRLEEIIGLVGAICFSTLGLFIPAVIDCVLRWDTGFGRFKWVLVKNILLVLFSILALFSGTYSSISSLLREDKETV